MTRTLRLLAGTMIAAGGLVHWDLWRQGYRAIPNVGTLFVVNVVASAVLAVALVATADRRVTVAAALLSLASLAALVLSRTTGFLGFVETSWTTEALRAVAAEVGALVALGVWWTGAGQAVLIPARVRSASGERGR